MKEYLKMSDVFRDSVLSDGTTAYTLIDEADRFGVIHKVNGDTLVCSGADVAEYAAHAINSHDELVGEVELLRGVIELVISKSHELAGRTPTTPWGDGYKECALATAHAIEGLIGELA